MIQGEIQNTIKLEAGKPVTLGFEQARGLDFFNYGPGRVWVNWSGGEVEVNGPHSTPIEPNLGYSRPLQCMTSNGPIVAISPVIFFLAEDLDALIIVNSL